MIVEDKFFLSTDNETQIHYTVWTPEEPPVAVCQICHGMVEHISRYDDFARFLAGKGIVVCGCDHKGHGQSKGKAYGYFGKGKALDVLVSDQLRLTDMMREKYKHLPYVLLGHSMGSFVARRYISENKGKIDGAIICGTAGPGQPVGAGIALSKIVGVFKNETKPCPFLGKIAFAGYNKRTNSDNPYAWLTRDEKIVDAYSKDELCGFSFTASAYKQMFECIKIVNAPEWAGKVDKSLSVLVTAGKEDPVGSYGEGPQKVYEALKDAEMYDVQFKLYDDCRHEILNELNKEEVYGDFLAFILHVVEGVRALKNAKEG